MRTYLGWLVYALAILFAHAPTVCGQTDSAQLSPAEHYNSILLLMAQQDYAQALTESKKLIERAPRFEHIYPKFALAAVAANHLDEAQAFLATQRAQTPPNPLAAMGIGLLYHQRKDFAVALEYYKKTLAELPEYERNFQWLVMAYRNLKKQSESESFIKGVLAAHPQSAAAHFGLGFHYFQYQQYEAARVELETAIALNPLMADAYYFRAGTYFNQSRYQECLFAIQQAVRLAETAQDEERQRPMLLLNGDAERRLGNYPEAANILYKALALSQKCGDYYIQESCLSQLGSVYFRQDNYFQALHHWQQALAIARQIKGFTSRNLGNIGETYYRLGDLPAALQHYQQALALAESSKDEPSQANLLISIGDIYIEQRMLPQAAAHYEPALKLTEKLASSSLLITGLNSLAALYSQTGDYAKATVAIQQAVKLAQETASPVWIGRSLNNQGALHWRLGEFQAALRDYEHVLSIEESRNSPRNIWQAHAGLAITYEKLGQSEQARDHYRKAIEVMERVRAQLGGEEEKAGFFQDKNEAYKQLIALLLAPSRSATVSLPATAQRRDEAEAFHYAERARARAFLDLLAEAKVNLEQSLDHDLLDRQQALQKQIAQVNAQLLKERTQELAKQDKAKIAELETGLSRADAEQRDWQNEVRRRNPHYAALKYPEPVTLAETQRLLDEGTVLLAYSLGETESFLFAVSRRELLVTRLPAAASIGQNVEKLLAAITDKNRPAAAEYRRQASELSKQLIQPARRLLAGKRALVIVPDGALHRLPFEVLFTSTAAAQGDLRRLPYLIKDFAISYAPSASVLAGLRSETRVAAPKAFVAYADPVYEQNAETVIASTVRATSAGGRLSLNPLPHSRREAEGIAKLFSNGAADLFLGAAASEENVKLQDRLSQYRLVHFSTHGYVNEARPRFSGLVLSLPPTDKAAQSEDGLLSAYEIFNLKLNAELVVLSACETGLGKEVKGEGLMSLMRAFMYAGTPSVLVSLWQVDDASTAELMIRFYRYQQQGVKQGKTTVKLNQAEALRHAQLDSLAQGNFPYYWAPFVLVGRP